MRQTHKHLLLTAVSVCLFFAAMPLNAKDLTVLEDWGQAQGAGTFSLLDNADALQISAVLDVPASIALVDSKISGHVPIFRADLLLRAWRSKASKDRSLWLATSLKPQGVSTPFPRADRLSQDGFVLNELALMGIGRVGEGKLRVKAGIVRQHLGRSDTIYWTTFRPNLTADRDLRLFDTSLGLNTAYTYASFYSRIAVGSPILRDKSPFASTKGLTTQLIAGWSDSDAHVLMGAELASGTEQNTRELNLHWALPLSHVGFAAPLTVFGEIGAVTHPDTNENAIGALYAHHELALLLERFRLRIRYDWIDRDTYFKYDTTHIVRLRTDFKVTQYVDLSAQIRHRWNNTENRTDTENDDILLFVRLLY